MAGDELGDHAAPFQISIEPSVVVVDPFTTCVLPTAAQKVALVHEMFTNPDEGLGSADQAGAEAWAEPLATTQYARVPAAMTHPAMIRSQPTSGDLLEPMSTPTIPP
jgi:hypothetical protein